MVSAVAIRSGSGQTEACPKQSLIALADAQLALAAAIDELEAIAAAAVPPPLHALARARYAVSLAARTRMLVGSGITLLLARRAGVRAESALQQHKAMRAALDSFARDYVAFWTLERVAADWNGYRKASSEKRALLRDSIRLEKELLEPLLRSMV